MYLQFFDGDGVIGIDAHSAGNLHSFFGDLAGRQFGMTGEGFGGGLGVGTSAADGGDSSIGLDDVALSAEQESLLLIADQQQCFEMAQEFIGTPVFGELDGAAAKVAVILLELGFEAAEKGEGVGSRAGESGEDFVVVEPADFPGRVLDDRFAERDLAVSGKDYATVAADG